VALVDSRKPNRRFLDPVDLFTDARMTDAPPLLATMVLAVIALGNLVRGILFLAGRAKGPAHDYFDKSKPVQVRNFAFAYLPLGLGLTALVLAIPAYYLPGDLGIAATLGLAALSFLGVFTASRWVLHPPQALKPAWLQQQEQAPENLGAEASDASIDIWIIGAAGVVSLAAAALLALLAIGSAAAVVLAHF
jgi:hypothetical protein